MKKQSFRRLAALLLAAALAVTACACGKQEETTVDPSLVEPSELRQSAKLLADDHPGLTFRAFTVGTIPVVEVLTDDDTLRPLAVVYHAEGECKEDALEAAVTFAEAGYRAFVMDAPSHGEAADGQTRTLPEIAVEYAKQTDSVLTYYYSGVESADLTRIAVCGESMGGMAALWYLAHGEHRPFGTAVAMATPSWQSMNPDGLISQSWCDGEQVYGRNAAELPEGFLAENEPSAMTRVFRHAPVYIISGAEDEDVTTDSIYSWYGPAIEEGAENLHWEIYQGCRHDDRPADFAANAVSWLADYLPELESEEEEAEAEETSEAEETETEETSEAEETEAEE